MNPTLPNLKVESPRDREVDNRSRSRSLDGGTDCRDRNFTTRRALNRHLVREAKPAGLACAHDLVLMGYRPNGLDFFRDQTTDSQLTEWEMAYRPSVGMGTSGGDWGNIAAALRSHW